MTTTWASATSQHMIIGNVGNTLGLLTRANIGFGQQQCRLWEHVVKMRQYQLTARQIGFGSFNSGSGNIGLFNFRAANIDSLTLAAATLASYPGSFNTSASETPGNTNTGSAQPKMRQHGRQLRQLQHR